ncbi:transcription factor VOZ1-like [Panicum miliaceum]|uniref:Transcription factor VOZ1-like n=1 Tax=Panicum miliaceum TaxID=4540 RepID=A0A3L6STT3_PANMI|nr:transcription factor VOZ1-like [Panicum miliaceum]
MLREWRAELSVPTPASSLQATQNSQENNREASDPPSEMLRLLQLVVAEEDDATRGSQCPDRCCRFRLFIRTKGRGTGRKSRCPISISSVKLWLAALPPRSSRWILECREIVEK